MSDNQTTAEGTAPGADSSSKHYPDRLRAGYVNIPRGPLV